MRIVSYADLAFCSVAIGFAAGEKNDALTALEFAAFVTNNNSRCLMYKAHRELPFEYAKASVAEVIADIRLAHGEIVGTDENMVVPDVLNKYFKSFRFCNFVTLGEQNQPILSALSSGSDNGFNKEKILHCCYFHIELVAHCHAYLNACRKHKAAVVGHDGTLVLGNCEVVVISLSYD